MTYRSLSANLSRLLAAVLSIQMVLGDMPAFASLPPSPRPLASSVSVSANPSFSLSAEASDLRALLAGAGSFGGAVPAATSAPLLIHIQDIHGHPRAQKNIEIAVDRLVSRAHLGGVLLEGLSGELDAASFRKSPVREVTDAAIEELLVERRLSGAAAALLSGSGPVPPVTGLEDERIYRANLAAVPAALASQPSFTSGLAPIVDALGDLKKKIFNEQLFITDLAVSRYEDGRMPLVSLLALLSHRGATLDAAMASILKVQAAEQLYDAADVGSELRGLVDRLRGRLSPSEAAALFDASFRFQKGRLRLEEFLETLTSLCAAHSIDLASYPNLRLHLEHALLVQSVSPDELYAAVERLRPMALSPLATTDAERDLLALDRRARLLSKLSKMTMSPSEWAELRAPARRSDNAGISALSASLASLEESLEPAKNFYRYAEQRNREFEANIRRASASAGSQPLLVVAGGFHGDAIARVAAHLGRRYVSFTPSTGDLRSWDAAAPLRDLARPLDVWDQAAEARSQTLAPAPAPVGAVSRIAAAAIARGTMTNNAAAIQWGRETLGRLGISYRSADVTRTRSGAHVRVHVARGGRESTLDVTYGNAGIVMVAMQGFFARTLGRLWKAIVRLYYARFGITITDINLHTGGKVWIRVVPRKPGNGVNFYRADITGVSMAARRIPAALGFIARNRRRLTGLEIHGFEVLTVEHLLFGLSVNRIRDADIYVYGNELPILDGSAQMFVDALRPLQGWSPPAPEFRLHEPVVFRRDNKTAVMFLPLDDDETDSEFIFVGNYGTLQKTPIEFRVSVKDGDLGELVAEVGSHPTFLERPLSDVQPHFFNGAHAYAPGELEDPNRSRLVPRPNYVDVSNPDNWTNGNIDLERLARHKVMDLIGDTSLLEFTKNARGKWRVIALGTGHRDTAEAMIKVASGYRYPVGYQQLVDINLAELLAANKISPALHDYIVAKLEPYRDYDKDLITAGNPQDVPPLPADVLARLNTAFRWAGQPPRDLPGVLEDIKQYFLRSNGSALVTVSENVATQRFVPDQIREIDVQLWDENVTERTFLVSFARGGELVENRPKVKLVMSKYPGNEQFSQAIYNGRRADEAIEVRRRRAMGPGYVPRTASDRAMEGFPKMGPQKGEFYTVEWVEDQHARYSMVLTRPNLSLQDTEVDFDAFWAHASGEVERQHLGAAEQVDVARAAAEMMTDGFLTLFRDRPLTAAPMTGHLIENIDFTRDFVYDPVDKRAGLGMVRSLRAVGVEQFLFHVLHLQMTYEFDRQSKFLPAPGRRIRKEWQPFAMRTDALLEGVQAALEKNFGAVAGRAAALVWFQRYLEAVQNVEQGPLQNKGADADRTWKFRYIRVLSQYRPLENEPPPAPGSPHEDSIGFADGQAIRPVLLAKIQTLRAEVAQDEVSGAVRWIARLVSRLTLLPMEVSLRLAPLTEAVAFSSMGIFIREILIGSGAITNHLWAATLGAAGSLIAWLLSHTIVLVTSVDGQRWVEFPQLALRLRLKIYWLGAIVAVLPNLAYETGGPTLAFATALVAAALHFDVNPPVLAERQGEDAAPLLGLRQRIRRFVDGSA